MGLTDNAVRGHVAALSREGLVHDAGVQRDTGGKPARLYALTREGEELFPKAYALVLSSLIEEIARTEGRDRALALMRSVGRRMASGAETRDDPEAGIAAARDALRSIGGDVTVTRTDHGWNVEGYACPFSAVTAEHAEVCEMARAMIEGITGLPVSECCRRGDKPRCAFTIEAA